MQRRIGRGLRVVEGATIVLGTVLGVTWAFSAPVDIAARLTEGVHAQSKPAAPAYKVDPLWPKPLPNGWILGSVTGVAVDSQDHIWIVHRGAASLTARTENGLGTDPPTAEVCCRPAPPVLEFDQSGALVNSWGGPGEGYDWPESPGGIAVDATGTVWIAAAGFPEAVAGRGRGRGATGGTGGTGAAASTATTPPPAPRPVDAHVLQFTRAGKFVRQIGKPGVTLGPDSQTSLNRPANVEIDAAAKEIYVADGHSNRRVVVFDAATGAYKRQWSAYGTAPDATNPGPYDPAAPPAKQFRTVSCVTIAKDGMVYVCDRQNNRVQVFSKDGKFLKEAIVSKATLGNGAVWDIALSSDAAQRQLFIADGTDQKIFILRRDTLTPAGEFGAGGRWPGHFYGVGSIAVDSRGNVYTGETFEGKRVQKFLPQR
jgi:DNA-binding beta-propeller fold protein YncE